METSKSSHKLLDLASTDPARLRPARRPENMADSDMFLELAKDDLLDKDGDDTVSRAGSHVSRLKSYPPPSVKYQYPDTPGIARRTPLVKFPPAGRSLSKHVYSSPTSSHGPNLQQRESSSRTNADSAFTPEHRRVSPGEINLSMPPFRRSYRPSNFSSLANDRPRNYDSPLQSPLAWTTSTVSASTSCADGIESIGSVTAVSTIFDEAEELRNRIQRFRSTTRRSNIGGTVGEQTGERPNTATTMTTNSTSSRQVKRINPGKAEPVVCETRSHQLLQTALGRVRDQVDTQVYRALSSCATDVIQVSSILEISDCESRADETVTSPSIVRTASDRKLRRKVDNLCQSLTELCIALREEIDTPNQMPEYSTSLVKHKLSSAGVSSLEPSPTIQHSTSIQQMRSRRPSTGTTHKESPFGDLAFARTRNKPATTLSQDDASTDRGTTVRAPSRATTEADASNASSHGTRGDAKKKSRDYTDHHPLPDTWSPSLRNTLATNHSNVSLNSAYTTMSNISLRPGRYRPNDWKTDPTGSSPLLEQRLARRREQKKPTTSSNIASLDQTSSPASEERPSQRLLALSGSAQRAQGNGKSGSRYLNARESPG